MKKMSEYQYIGPRQTPRKCATCQQPANQFRFTTDKLGAINKSSRTPVCDSHGGDFPNEAV
jgi:hypothetical protein